MKRIGIYGGTFDPPHLAHLGLARCARDELSLDEVRWLPAGQPWQKARAITPAAHRLAMVALAIEGESRFVLDDRETRRTGPSYTIDTVQELRAEQPGAELVLVLGADQHRGLPTWHRWNELQPLVTIAVAQRPGAAAAQAGAPHHIPLPMPPMDVSATRIRELAARGEPIAALVPDAVARYIAQHRLYRN